MQLLYHLFGIHTFKCPRINNNFLGKPQNCIPTKLNDSTVNVIDF